MATRGSANGSTQVFGVLSSVSTQFARLVNLSRVAFYSMMLLSLPHCARSNRSDAVVHRDDACSLEFSPTAQALTDSRGALYYVDQPVVANVRGGEMWFGPGIMPWPARKASFSAVGGILKHNSGELEEIVKPFSVLGMTLPLLLKTSDSVAHIVWGDRTDTSTGVMSSYVQTVSYSSFDGNVWSPPAVVLKAPRIDWTPSQPPE